MPARAQIVGVALILTVLAAPRAYAQEENKLAVGLSAAGYIAGSSRMGGSHEVGFEWRFGHETRGWGWQYDPWNWFSADVNQPIGGENSVLGTLRVRPLLGGFGHTWIRNRLSITAELMGGYAINSFQLTPAADDQYRALGARNVTADGANSFVFKPGVHAWYDVTKRIGVRVMAGYLVARPTVTVHSSLGDDSRRITADTVLVDFGLVYKIF